MATNIARRAATENLRSIAFGSLTDTYMSLGTALENPARILVWQNLTNKTVFISDNGLNDKFVMPASGYFVLDLTANASIDGYFYAEGTQWYVRGVTADLPTSGSVYLAVLYGRID